MKIILFTTLFFLLSGCASDWRTASRKSAGIAPKLTELKETILQIYVARTMSWRGWCAVHPWVTWKLKDDKQYTVAQVIGWRTRRGLSSVVVENDLPDRYWFGSKPDLIYDIRGEKAEAA